MEAVDYHTPSNTLTLTLALTSLPEPRKMRYACHFPLPPVGHLPLTREQSTKDIL